MKILFGILLFLQCLIADAQTDSASRQRMRSYLSHADKARAFTADKEYAASIAEYKQAFLYAQFYVPDLLSCSESFSALGNIDSAFGMLVVAAANGYDWHDDPNLTAWRQSPIFDEAKLQKVRTDFYRRVDREYLELLDSMEVKDQSVRGIHGDTARMADVDSADMEILAQLVRAKGFPRYDKVGYAGVMDAFVLLLHGLLNGVHGQKMWTYFQPVLYREVQQGYLMPDYYAFIYDRIVSDYGRLEQCYGTHFDYSPEGTVVINPVYDVAHVDARRAEIGLPPLRYMIKTYHMTAPQGYQTR
ncbi:MAG: hypothetical protein JST90_11940 [Bacteroidetes bacterium]|nr:hypothetical protein [Bacteroidota bacterium]